LTRSVVRLLGVELSVPDYTTLCRRRRASQIESPRRSKREPLRLVVDSTGIKVYGEGEWKVRQHGCSRRRTRRKLHPGVDEAAGEFVAAVATTNDFKDSQLLPDLLAQVEDEIGQVSADGAYDSRLLCKVNAQAAAASARSLRLYKRSSKCQ
jgi:IS5 family transposase